MSRKATLITAAATAGGATVVIAGLVALAVAPVVVSQSDTPGAPGVPALPATGHGYAVELSI